MDVIACGRRTNIKTLNAIWRRETRSISNRLGSNTFTTFFLQKKKEKTNNIIPSLEIG
jgi:hypothetical protein